MKRQSASCLTELQDELNEAAERTAELQDQMETERANVMFHLKEAVDKKFAIPSDLSIMQSVGKWVVTLGNGVARFQLSDKHRAFLVYNTKNELLLTVCYHPVTYLQFESKARLDGRENIGSMLFKQTFGINFTRSEELFNFIEETYKRYTTTRILTARREIVWFRLYCPKILPMDILKIVFDKLK